MAITVFKALRVLDNVTQALVYSRTGINTATLSQIETRGLLPIEYQKNALSKLYPDVAPETLFKSVDDLSENELAAVLGPERVAKIHKATAAAHSVKPAESRLRTWARQAAQKYNRLMS